MNERTNEMMKTEWTQQMCGGSAGQAAGNVQNSTWIGTNFVVVLSRWRPVLASDTDGRIDGEAMMKN